ncbi:TIGR02206 family membrane protein [Sediminibacillus albus]|uniref:Conserved hypothetical integral membrane protein TIGR02206 n=1 Tax=Sediminibacillus albus TaxID=407036 RepID=A0A1G8ZMZ1_9BACI|nr:TIGR02206 family membrane protein [Sediminibacillus albus]SDK16397.1 conserved hypothetical integral membrane protein TIGR02206 [Sediminibacillus albus]
MDTWFGVSSTHLFHPFSASHLLMLIIYSAGAAALLINSSRISQRPSLYRAIRWGFLIVLVLSELVYQGWAIYHHMWSFPDHMPLHLCGIASITAMLALLFQKDKLIQMTFFLAVIPAFLALVTPDIPYGYEHFRFWKFFIHHMAISWSGIFLSMAGNTNITFASMMRTFLLLIAYALFIGMIINPLTGANYLYLARPAEDTLLTLFGEGFSYYINLSTTALIVFYLLYLSMKFYRRSRQIR